MIKPFVVKTKNSTVFKVAVSWRIDSFARLGKVDEKYDLALFDIMMRK